jgi:hypothetical protein
MAITALDTHQTVKDLTAAGFTDSQAEALAYALRQSQQIDLSGLATKSDLSELRAATKSDLSELKTDITELRATTKSDLAEVRREMAEMKAELIKWMIGMTFAGGGAVVALVRLVVGGHS